LSYEERFPEGDLEVFGLNMIENYKQLRYKFW